MKNKLIDLNNHLFEQIERLNNEMLKGDQLKAEISRSKAMANISGQIINNASLALEAEKLAVEHREFKKPTVLVSDNSMGPSLKLATDTKPVQKRTRYEQQW